MFIQRLKAWAKALFEDLATLVLALKQPNVRLIAKALILITAAYALSPIDLIPDAIPVVGYLDDLLILPIGIWLARNLIDDQILEQLRARASKVTLSKPQKWLAASTVFATWISTVAIIAYLYLA